MNLLTINHLTKSYTDKILFQDVDFSIHDGEKVGVIGINGTGKSSLLKIVAGLEEGENGEVIKGNQVHICYLPQNPVFPEESTIYSYVYEQDYQKEAKSILNRLGFEDTSILIKTLSGGQKKRVALAAALLKTCEILILDEPTNHLDNDMVIWLEDYLKKRKGALLMVTHDRYFLDRVSTRILEIDKGKLYSYDTNYSGFLALKAEREEMEIAAERKRRSILREEIEWMQRGARARSTKQKAHIERYEKLRDQTGPVEDQQIAMSSTSTRMGRTTIELSHISKAYDEHKLMEDFSYIFLKNDRVGFIGSNGCGKSTLMKIITEKIEPDSGVITIGTTVKIGYFSQENEYMEESLRVLDYVRETAEYIDTVDGKMTASAMCERFLFDGTLQYQTIERLSGGEKRRLYLLKVLMEAPNVLVLDEPTNDLDIETLSILEDYLEHFDGIVIVVSHDRYFLDRVVTRIFAFEKNGRIRQYEGGYSDYAQAVSFLQEDHEQENQELKKGQADEKSSYDTWKNQKSRKLKFTFAEQKEFENIEGEISQLEEKIDVINQQIPLAATDFVKLSALSEEKERLEEELLNKMDRWEYLTELSEKIKGD